MLRLKHELWTFYLGQVTGYFKDNCAAVIKLSHLIVKMTLHTKKEEMRL
jgi:hypothetical protein